MRRAVSRCPSSCSSRPPRRAGSTSCGPPAGAADRRGAAARRAVPALVGAARLATCSSGPRPGSLLGLVLRWARVERLTAALLLALAVGLWVYLTDALSIAVVRQIPARDALDLAGRVHAVYLASALAGLGGGLVTEPRSRGGRGSLVLAWLVAAAGGLNVLHAVLPGDDEGLLRSLTPDAVGPLARAAAVLTGIALLLAARGLLRRRRRAWVVAVSVAALSTALHVLHGLNGGTLASAVVLLALVARRHDYDGPGDVATRRVTLAAGRGGRGRPILGYGAAALWVNRMVADQPFTPGFALREIGAGLFGLNIQRLASPGRSVRRVVSVVAAPARCRGDRVGDRRLARSLAVPGAAGGARPAARRRARLDLGRRHARAVRAARRQVVLLRQGSLLVPRLSRRRLRRDRLGRSDRARGRPRRADRLVRRLRARVRLARGDSRRVRAPPRAVPAPRPACALPRRRGGRRHGRRSRSKAARSARCGSRTTGSSTPGTNFASCDRASSTPSCAPSCRRSPTSGAATQPERGFVMALDTLFALGDDHAVFAVGFGPDGRVGGFLHFAVARAGGALSLSSMPRLRTTPNGFNEWLICGAIEWARTAGYDARLAQLRAVRRPPHAGGRALAACRRCSAVLCCG